MTRSTDISMRNFCYDSHNYSVKKIKMYHKFGAHLSISGGLYKALESIKNKEGNCLQIFSSSPRTWQLANISKEDIAFFIKIKHSLQIDPIFFHAMYLINLADSGQTGEKS